MVSPKSNFYTYAYLRKRDNTPYYVGKGNGRRAFVKHKGISVPKDRSKIIFLKQNLTEEEAFKHEKYMIAVFGRKDLGTGILLNKTDGGDGVSGHVKTEKQIEVNRKTGRTLYEKGMGIHALTKEERIEIGKKMGIKSRDLKVGIHGLTKEEKSKNGKKSHNLGVGIHALSKEQLSENGTKGGLKGGKISGNKHKENKTGVCGRSKEQMTEDGKKGGKIGGIKGGKIGGNKCKENKTGICGLSLEELSEAGKKGGKTTASQKWQCTETGYTSTAGGLTCYQNKRGIDISNRIKVDGPRSWEITFEDDRVVVTTQTLKAWSKENGYNYSGVIKVRGGQCSNYKGIIKVFCL
jgi:hypothetical protein